MNSRRLTSSQLIVVLVTLVLLSSGCAPLFGVTMSENCRSTYDACTNNCGGGSSSSSINPFWGMCISDCNTKAKSCR